jgi:hypothetical protein
MYVIRAARMGRATSIGLRPLRKDDFKFAGHEPKNLLGSKMVNRETELVKM